MKNTTSDEQLQILKDTWFNSFGHASFTRSEFIDIFGNVQTSHSFLGNGVAKGWLTLDKSNRPGKYALTAKAIELATGTTPAVKVAPIPDPPNAKSPEAILRQVRRQLEDQIDLIDEALENINRSNDDAAKFRAIEKLIKG